MTDMLESNRKKTKTPSILIFSAYIPPHTGGIERYVDNLAKELVKHHYTPVIITANHDDLPAQEKINGVQIFRLPIFSLFKNRYPIPKSHKLPQWLLERLSQYDVQAIIVNARFYLTSQIGARYGQQHGIPVYLIEHGSSYVTLDNPVIDFFANRYEDFLTKKIKSKVTGFYGVSEACNTWLRKIGISSSGVWYNSIDCEHPTVPQPHSGINFFYAGRILKQKGVQNILEAFTRLQEEYTQDDINLYIAGDGPDLNAYKKQYQNPKIHFLGRLNSDELRRYYSMCDIFLFPPQHPEGLPTVLLEAGLAKCAVIGTDQGGISEVIQNGKNGIIIESTTDALLEAMKQLLNDQELLSRLANALFQTIQQDFSWQNTVQKILHNIKKSK